MRARALRIVRNGDLTAWRADAIVTSANAGLCGNKTPGYWRFRVPSGAEADELQTSGDRPEQQTETRAREAYRAHTHATDCAHASH